MALTLTEAPAERRGLCLSGVATIVGIALSISDWQGLGSALTLLGAGGLVLYLHRFGRAGTAALHREE